MLNVFYVCRLTRVAGRNIKNKRADNISILKIQGHGKGFESLRPLQGRLRGLHDSCYQARHDAPLNLRHF